MVVWIEAQRINFDEIWYTTADLELDDTHMTKYEMLLKFSMADGRHIENRYVEVTQQPVVRFQWSVSWGGK